MIKLSKINKIQTNNIEEQEVGNFNENPSGEKKLNLRVNEAREHDFTERQDI